METSEPTTSEARERPNAAALRAQFFAVRREIDLRIAIQSALVTFAALGVLLAAIIMSFAPSKGLEITAAFAAMDLFLALHWMHNDVRHLQLGRYLAEEVEPKLASGARGWEEVHSALPPETLLGSYSIVGRQAIFVAAPLVVLALARQDYSCARYDGWIPSILALSTAIFFLTRLPRQPQRVAMKGPAD